jgi:hypothetical protein
MIQVKPSLPQSSRSFGSVGVFLSTEQVKLSPTDDSLFLDADVAGTQQIAQ